MSTFILADDLHADESAGAAEFLLRLSAPATQRVSVAYALADVTATRLDDYLTVLGVANFEPGITQLPIRVPIVNDALGEATEAFQLLLSSPVGAVLSRRSVNAYVHDNDRPTGTPFIRVDDVIVDESAGMARFWVVLDRPSAGLVEVRYATDSGNAISGLDFQPTGGVLRFEPGQMVAPIDVPILNDTLPESDESFSLLLVSAAGAILTSTSASAVIAGNDAPPVARPVVRTFADAIGEGQGWGEVVVQLSGPGTDAVSLVLSTSSLWQGSTPGLDYPAAQSQPIVLMPGQTMARVPLFVTDDSAVESLESLLVNTSIVSDPPQGVRETLLFLLDNDAAAATPSVLLRDLTLDERDGSARFNLTLSQPAAGNVSLDWATEAGTALPGEDYVAGTGRIVFAPGEQSKTVVIPILDDTRAEGDEFFSLRLSAVSGATLPTNLAQAVIAANDGPPTSRPLALMRPLTVDENDGYAEFAIRLSAPGTETATLRYNANSLTAQGADLLPMGTANSFNATLVFEPGRTLNTLRIPIIDDALVERIETLQVTLSVPIELDLATDRELIAILDNDAPTGSPVASVSDAIVEESDGFALVTVSLDRPSADGFFLNYGTAGGSAITGADFSPISGLLSFAPGEVSRSLRIPIINDAIPEDTEVFELRISGPSAASVADATGAISIARNDLPVSARPVVTVDAARVGENEPWVDAVLRLDRPSATPIILSFATSNVSATSTADFRAAFGPVSFAPGSTVASVRFALTDDSLSEGTESFSFNLMPSSAVGIPVASTLMTIVDDDATGGQFVFGPPQIDRPEGSTESLWSMEVERLGNRSQSASLNWSIVASGPGAADTGDFVGSSLPAGRLIFVPGQLSQRISFGVQGDATPELHETFQLVLADAQGASLAGTSLSGRLRNDDTAPRSGVPALGRDDSFLFDPTFFFWKYPELAATLDQASAANWWLSTGAAQGRSPNAWFDAAWYATRWADLSGLGLDNATLFRHFNLYGVWEGRAPGPLFANFDGNRYLADNPDVAGYVDANVADFLGSRSNGAIAHFLIYGAAEQRQAWDGNRQPIVMDYLLG